MIEALALFVALSTADAVGRASPEFALHGELGRFPPAAVLEPLECLADEHFAWLTHHRETERDIIPDMEERYEHQYRVTCCYHRLAEARFEARDYEGRRECADQLRELLGDVDYFFGRLPGPIPGWGR